MGAVIGFALLGVGAANAAAGPGAPNRAHFDLGADLYQLRCSGCHGLEGDGLIGPSLVDSVLPVAEVVDQITNGAGSMPAFSGVLSAAEIDAVAQHVIGFRPAPPTTTTSTTTTTSPTTTTASTTTSTSLTTTTSTSTTTTAPTTSTTAPPTTTTSTTTSTTIGSTTSSTDPVAPEAATAVDAAGGSLVVPLAIAGVALAAGLWFVVRRRRTG